MKRELVARFAAFALCMGSATPAAAQDHRFAGFDAPPGASATVNLRVPLGAASRRSRPTFGLTLGLGRTIGGGIDGAPIVRQVPIADLRFSETGVANARVGSLDLAHPDRTLHLTLGGGKKGTLFMAGVVVVAGVVICLAADCFGDNEPDDQSDSDTATPTPG